MARRLQLGLMRYAVQMPLADVLAVSHDAGATVVSVNAQPEDDPWNFWLFRTQFDTQLSSEERETSKEFGGALSANRTTEQWKINLGLDVEYEVEYEEESFDLRSGEMFKNVSRDNAVTARVIKSLGDHWGLG